MIIKGLASAAAAIFFTYLYHGTHMEFLILYFSIFNSTVIIDKLIFTGE